VVRALLVERLLRDEALVAHVLGALEALRLQARLRAARASTAANSAWSRRTSTAPRSTRWPSLKRISAMRPAISGRSVTASSARSVPTALASSIAGATFAIAARTGIAGGAFGCASAHAGAMEISRARARRMVSA
jgi:hypothetical protein